MITRFYHPTTQDGWQLELRQVYDPSCLDRARRPLVVIPGYGMNSFIFGFHPNGMSLESFLARAGFEVWCANLRGQGNSRHRTAGLGFGFRELALVDLPCIFETVRSHRQSRSERIDPIGCSLGATLLYAYLAHNLSSHPFGAMVSIGGPLRWDRVHPLVSLLFSSPALAGAVPIQGTRSMIRGAIPFAKRIPGLLSLYMNTENIDLAHIEKLSQTVEDPNSTLNKQIALWVKQKDLVVAGQNVTDALRDLSLPMYCIYANRDGVVMPEASLSIQHILRDTRSLETLCVGNEKTWFAHADLFVSRYSHEWVFQPMVQWLRGKKS